jgi:hypothetical protein
MLFGKGQWAILGLKVDSFPKFQATLADPLKTLLVSQLVASIRTRFKNCSTVGINPFDKPRMDEVLAESPNSVSLVDPGVEDIQHYLELRETMGPDYSATFDPLCYAKAYGAVEPDFVLDANLFNTYGFWVVFNDYEDVSDVASKKEQLAYETLGRPYKFAVKDDKSRIDLTANGFSIHARKQFPVIVDYQTGRVFIASSNTEEILTVRQMLENMGAVVNSVYWSFGKPDWTRDFLTKISETTKFEAEFQKRTEERTRFTKEQVEKLEDKMMERIVSTFFSLAELPTGQWAGLKAPTRLKMMKTAEPVSCADPTAAFYIRYMANEFEVVSAGVVFQELTSRLMKDKEIPVRHDLFTLTIDDNINNFDAGAAMLKGFDLPKYKNEMKQFLKQKGQAAIKDYWYNWCSGMRGAIAYFVDNVAETLDLKASSNIKPDEYGLLAAKYDAAEVSDIAANL